MLNMNAEALKEALSAPFEDSDIEWRVGVTTKDKARGLAVPYVTNRAIQNRLDSTLGVDGWYNDYKPWPNDAKSQKSAQICGISIYFPQIDLWITKWDGAENSEYEAVKGGLSESMKRAAVQWGIGRYLYGMAQVWTEILPRGNGYYIPDKERPKLDQTHAEWVQHFKSKQPAPQVMPKPTQGGATQIGSGLESMAQGTPSPQVIQTTPQSNTPPAQVQPATQPATQPVYYQVTGSVLKPAMNGGQYTSLMLSKADGNTIQAFWQGVTPELIPGVWLENVVLSQKNQHGIVFYTLDSYELYTGRQAA